MQLKPLNRPVFAGRAVNPKGEQSDGRAVQPKDRLVKAVTKEEAERQVLTFQGLKKRLGTWWANLRK